jgi:N-formylglutamate amidohydrolase
MQLTLPPAFELSEPPHPAAIILMSAHSGCYYPPDWQASSRLDPLTLRRSEDAFIDDLISSGPDLGMTLLRAGYARAYLDVNRDPSELDPCLFYDAPTRQHKLSDRVKAGLGVVPRMVGIGMDIYPNKIPIAEALRRIAHIHMPYHAKLTDLAAQSMAAHGYAVLLDWHSMPSGAVAEKGRLAPDIVLGDRHGLACDPALTQLIRDAFRAHGLRVVVNDPYAGGYTTERYGQPFAGVHTLQIELNRQLYMDEIKIEKSLGYSSLQRVISEVLTHVSRSLPQLPLAQSNLAPLSLAAE